MQVPPCLVKLLIRRLPRLFDKMMEKYKLVVTPIKEQYPMRERSQFPHVSVYMFYTWFSDTCSVIFQSSDVRQYLLVLNTRVFAGVRLVPKFLSRLLSVACLACPHKNALQTRTSSLLYTMGAL